MNGKLTEIISEDLMLASAYSSLQAADTTLERLSHEAQSRSWHDNTCSMAINDHMIIRRGLDQNESSSTSGITQTSP